MRQRRGIFNFSNGFADPDTFNASDGDNVTQLGLVDIDTLEAAEGKQLGDLPLLHRAIELGDACFLAIAQRSVEDAGNRQAAEIVAVVEVRYQDLQWAVRISRGRRSAGQDGVKQR